MTFLQPGLYNLSLGVGLARVIGHSQHHFIARHQGDERRQLTPEMFADAVHIEKPTPNELGALVANTPLQKVTGEHADYVIRSLRENMLLRLALDLDILKTETAGYFPEDKHDTWLTFQLASKLRDAIDWTARKAGGLKVGADATSKTLEWYKNPTKANWSALVGKPIEFSAWDVICHTTGKSFHWIFDGETAKVTAEYVAHKGTKVPLVPFEGKHLPPLQTDIELETGELVFANDLREFFPGVDDKTNVDYPAGSINHEAGRQRWTQVAAKLGLILAYGGDGGAYVFKSRKGLKVRAWCQDHEEKKALGNICLDLHWVSACDRSRLPADFDFKKFNAFSVKLPKGTYTVTSLKDSDETMVCTIEPNR